MDFLRTVRLLVFIGSGFGLDLDLVLVLVLFWFRPVSDLGFNFGF